MANEGGDDNLARQLQPHLASAAYGGGGVDNPALAAGDLEDVRVTVPSSGIPTAGQRNWERFDDAGNTSPATSPPHTQNTSTTNVPPAAPNGTHQSHSHGGTADSNSGGQIHSNGQTTPAKEHPVVYNCRSGEAVVVRGDAMAHGVPGTFISTQTIPERWREQERPLRARRMKIMKVLSVVAAVLFPPTGIPAAYYAWRTKREFDEGILRGNIDRAQKFSRRAERLVVLSFILVVLTAILVFALVERAAHGYRVEHSYVAHSSVQGRSL